MNIGAEALDQPHICFVALHVYPVLAADKNISFVGGAEVQQTVQMRALQRAGFKISVLVENQGQPDVVDCDGIEVRKVPDAGKRGIPLTRFFYPRITDIVSLLKQVSPDIVFIQTASVQVLAGALYARLFGKRFVFAGASDPDFKKGALPGMSSRHAVLYRLGLRAADAIIVQNVAQLQMLKDNFGRDGHLIQNGYEEPAAKPATFGNCVLWAATVKQLKRPDLFIELARRLPRLQFVMVGGSSVDTPEARAYTEAMSRQAAAVPNIRVVGHVPFSEVGEYFDRASIFVNTSDYEGLPNTFMQSWIRGIPTVSFVRPESAPGESGTIVSADLDAMVCEVERLASDPAAWQRASSSCRRIFQAHHTMDGAVERYRSVFASILPGTVSGQPCHR
jgi:glycosyltransferase involved in cell wall biosynthesis